MNDRPLPPEKCPHCRAPVAEETGGVMPADWEQRYALYAVGLYHPACLERERASRARRKAQRKERTR